MRLRAIHVRRHHCLSDLVKFKLLAIFLLIGAAGAEQNPANAVHVPDAPSAHKFWGTENKIEFSIFVGQVAADAMPS